ncbi:EamA family transporter RarD [Photobacterium ganghwense]|uniref:Permease n=1 Tax=Photobacterium ganghwense TaxID=320778 RepID=A0A0J1H8Y9_9GAMM|nr:EamA family transporter RarD [Photobacterium ganghwense]KLV08121.1 permease [Photobacterium ganghwense]PSU07242.1 EamA family transporter RarD [Photobacterium ganghwense]QSV15995.1 EamA family transporter RarD [Photobacterium ganghwense]
MRTQRVGNALAAFSFVLWGILPLYYQFLPEADINDLLALRILFSVPFMLLVMGMLKRPFPSLHTLWQDKRSLAVSGLAGLIMCISWYAFTWSLTHGQVLAASLGFFINPLFAVTLGVIFLKERLSAAQFVAVLLAIAGIGYQVWYYGELPWLSLIMGSFFALYGLCKKFIRYDALTSVTLESALLSPFALLFLLFSGFQGTSTALSSDTTTLLLYIGSAPVTLLPLIFFALAIQRTSLTMVGLMQYIEPSLQFMLAVWLFGEMFEPAKAISFGLIWLGLVICSLEALGGHLHHKLRAS